MTTATTARISEGVFACLVRGVPAPQGSKTPGVRNDGTPFLRDANPASLASWRTAVGFVLQNEWQGAPWEGPVVADIDFALLRPRSVGAKRRPQPTVKPDLDKLVRAILDALTGICIRDDAQIVELRATKAYDDDGDGPGVSIVLMRERDLA